MHKMHCMINDDDVRLSCCVFYANKRQRNDVIKMQFTKIKFDSIDDVMSLINSRFENAHVDMNESSRDTLIQTFSRFTKFEFDIDALHTLIEYHVRFNVAIHYMYEYMKQNDEFANVAITFDDYDAHEFTIFDVDQNCAIVSFRVNDNLTIRIIEL